MMVSVPKWIAIIAEAIGAGLGILVILWLALSALVTWIWLKKNVRDK